LYRHPADGNEMVLIPGGRSVIGSSADDSEARANEKPQFEVELLDYYIGMACVTNEQYLAFVEATKHRAPDNGFWQSAGKSQHPVVNVSWEDAVAYCQWAGLRLPRELEWEKSARGPQGFRYPWGDEWDATRCRHSVGGRSEGTCEVWDYPHGVSGYGLYNPGGNVWEWCSDWYDEKAYARYARGDLTSPASGTSRVVRGGSWSFDNASSFRAACRSYYYPAFRYFGNGFRCVRGL
jgi:formylglycine-generating enzyme required for sulfatase activity